MKQKTLKSLLGKFICAQEHLNYCHIEKILVIEESKAIAVATIKALNGIILCWILETSWQTDYCGVHSIIDYNILKEFEIDGYTT